MALTATMYHLRVDLSDVDRGVYEQLDLRPALHPSETPRYLLLRTLALCLLYEPGIAYSRGLHFTDEPAVWTRTPDGRPTLWVEIGRPAIERLHKASKLGARVVVFSDEGPENLRRSAQGQRLHRGDSIEVWTVDDALLARLEEALDRNIALTVVHTDGSLYVTAQGRTHEGTLRRAPLLAPDP